MRNWGKLAVVTLALAIGLVIAGPASAGVVQNSPAEKQYGKEPPAAANPTPDVAPQATPDVAPQATPDVAPQATPDVAPQAEPEIFLPPTVASAGQEDSSGLLPFTGAALIVPSVLGGLLLAGGLFLVYRTRRREV